MTADQQQQPPPNAWAQPPAQPPAQLQQTPAPAPAPVQQVQAPVQQQQQAPAPVASAVAASKKTTPDHSTSSMSWAQVTRPEDAIDAAPASLQTSDESSQHKKQQQEQQPGQQTSRKQTPKNNNNNSNNNNNNNNNHYSNNKKNKNNNNNNNNNNMGKANQNQQSQQPPTQVGPPVLTNIGKLTPQMMKERSVQLATSHTIALQAAQYSMDAVVYQAQLTTMYGFAPAEVGFGREDDRNYPFVSFYSMFPHLLHVNNTPAFDPRIVDSASFFVIKLEREQQLHHAVKYSVCTTREGPGILELSARFHSNQQMSAVDGIRRRIFIFFHIASNDNVAGMAEAVTGPMPAQHQPGDAMFHLNWVYVKDVPASKFPAGMFSPVKKSKPAAKPITNDNKDSVPTSADVTALAADVADLVVIDYSAPLRLVEHSMANEGLSVMVPVPVTTSVLMNFKFFDKIEAAGAIVHDSKTYVNDGHNNFHNRGGNFRNNRNNYNNNYNNRGNGNYTNNNNNRGNGNYHNNNNNRNNGGGNYNNGNNNNRGAGGGGGGGNNFRQGDGSNKPRFNNNNNNNNNGNSQAGQQQQQRNSDQGNNKPRYNNNNNNNNGKTTPGGSASRTRPSSGDGGAPRSSDGVGSKSSMSGGEGSRQIVGGDGTRPTTGAIQFEIKSKSKQSKKKKKKTEGSATTEGAAPAAIAASANAGEAAEVTK